MDDDRETIANLWVRPDDALDRLGRGEVDLIFPTIKNLEAIGRFGRSSDLHRRIRAVDRGPGRAIG